MQSETKRVWAGGVAAGLAGLSASESHATVIYTPADITIDASNPSASVDFEGDGNAPVSIDYDANGLTLQKGKSEKAYYVSDGSGNPIVAALPQGEEVFTSTQSGGKLGSYGSNGILNNGSGTGQFVASDPAQVQYIGVEWKDTKDSSYFNGWIGVEITGNSLADLSATITGFAYDDSGAFIATGATPEPSSLMLLAMGSAGLLAYRRRAPIIAK